MHKTKEEVQGLSSTLEYLFFLFWRGGSINTVGIKGPKTKMSGVVSRKLGYQRGESTTSEIGLYRGHLEERLTGGTQQTTGLMVRYEVVKVIE